MKKFIVIIFALLCVSFGASAKIGAAVYFDGYWSEWKHFGSGEELHGNYDGFVIYIKKEGIWNYRFKFKIDNMTFPNKKQRKKDIKANKWYEFTGTVEYYITDNYPTVLKLFRDAKGPMFAPAKLDNGRPTKKITSKAKIKIAAFKDLPEVYNIWFDGVGFGIDFNGASFPNQKFK